ncbi:MAG: BtpA/SgcQ family protein [Planctomycetota bacterium]|nr:BtpA/SgcQ family protein [Planctomycetota bacterium]MDG2084287.1 BtpA/SgcQ family protein [Planctomycetota bacterium]
MNFPITQGSRSIIGVIHLPALPGSPSQRLSRKEILDFALADTQALITGGVAGCIVENFGDAPFYPDQVEANTIAEMSVIIRAINDLAGDLPVGVNVLRNDASAALAIAAASGGSFIRVNVHTSAMLTDQGWIQGQAHHTLRQQQSWNAQHVSIAADVGVKHAVRPSGFDVEQAAQDVVKRGHAGAVIVTGSATGSSVDQGELKAVRAAVPEVPLLIGSGANEENISTLLSVADGAIVGTSLKLDGQVNAPVDVNRVRALVNKAQS